MEKTAYLILENGTVFKGKSFGYEGEAIGEIVFTTSMTGYLETLTDPSYFGQIVVQTFPLIGNYGVIPEDFESPTPKVKGYIVREWCQDPSNFRSQGNLDTFLKENKIPGICGIDTRALTKIVREWGVMNGKIAFSDTLSPEQKKELQEYAIVDAVKSVSIKEKKTTKGEKEDFKVVLWDFGAKANITKCLTQRGCTVTAVPYDTKASEIAAMKPDGIMLSNGPGDPAENTAVIGEIKKLMEYDIPIFGICLGHQLLALANGARTEKLKYGHRGANQPVMEPERDLVFVTSQNHGYCVVKESLPDYAKANFINVNDKTCEGITYDNIRAFSVQFHPEASAGPLDTGFLFDRFFKMMKGER